MGQRIQKFCDMTGAVENVRTVHVSVSIEGDDHPRGWDFDLSPRGIDLLDEALAPFQRATALGPPEMMPMGDMAATPVRVTPIRTDDDFAAWSESVTPTPVRAPVPERATTPKKATTKRPAPKKSKRPDPAVVRAWARENGWPQLGVRGVIKAEIWDTYMEAHQ